MLRRLIPLGVVVVVLVGCSTGPKSPSTRPSVAAAQEADTPGSPAPVHRPTTQPTPASEPLTSAEALAQTTAAYAQAIQSHMSRLKTPPAIKPPATAPAVQWNNPQTQPAISASPVRAVADDPTTRPIAIAPAATLPADPPVKVAADPPPPKILSQPPMLTSDQLEQQLARQISESPRDVSAHLEYQILQWLRGRQVPQMDAIAALPMEDRELLAAILDALSNFRSNLRGNENQLISRKARPLIELGERLRAQTSLSVGSMALCQKVYGFGAYDPLPSDRIIAGREVVVYCEIQNFSSRLNDRGLWQTDITQECVLYNDRGQRVVVEKRQPYADFSRNRRHDFCVARKMQLPASLPPGQYSLTVTISDQQANRMAEGSIPVRIAAAQEMRLARPD